MIFKHSFVMFTDLETTLFSLLIYYPIFNVYGSTLNDIVFH